MQTPDDGIKGLCLDIDFRDPECVKPNMILARLYRENGETVDSVGGNLNAPIPEGVTVNLRLPGQPVPPPSAWTAQTSFPWGKNNLDESWIEVSPLFAASIKKSTDHDHIVPWDQVCYDVLPVQNGSCTEKKVPLTQLMLTEAR